MTPRRPARPPPNPNASPSPRRTSPPTTPPGAPAAATFPCSPSISNCWRSAKFEHEKITTVAGIGCSSRFPYFVQAYGAHFIHGRGLPFASGISLTRPDLHPFVFGGDGDAFSIGGNHLTHTARKNINMTYVVMDNWVYGLTKKQTSPTSPSDSRARPTPRARWTSRSTR